MHHPESDPQIRALWSPSGAPPVRRWRNLLTLALLGSTLPALAAEAPTRHVLRGGTVVRAPGDTLRDATVVIEEGVIRRVGTNIAIPAGARIWDQEGRWIFAGLIDAHVEAGMGGDEPVAEGRGAQHPHPDMRAGVRAAELFNLDEKTRETYRDLGFTALNLAPRRGIFRGSSALVALGEEQGPREVLREQVQQIVAFERFPKREDAYPSSLMGSIAFIRQTWIDAHYQLQTWAHWRPEQERRPDRNLDLAALAPCLDKVALPVEFDADNPRNAVRAARIAREAGLSFVLLGGGREHEHLQEIAALQAPVVVPLNFAPRLKVEEMSADERFSVSLRDLRRWHEGPGNAAGLVQAKVPIALTTHRLKEPSAFPEALRKALEAGLSAEAALAALTTTPARLCGMAERLGVVKPGAMAHLVITDGPIFAEETEIQAVWVDGQRYLGPGERELARHSADSAEDEQPDEAAEEEEVAEAVEEAPIEVVRARKPGPLLTPRTVLFRDCTVWTQGPLGILEHADVLVVDGRIREVGEQLSAPRDAHVVAAEGRHLTPGLIDAHSHIAVDGDVNEGTQSCSSEVRIGDVINADAAVIYRQLAGGLTTSHPMHGSANPMGGQNATLKLRWGATDEGLKFEGAKPTIKFALGENVKQSNWGEKHTTRFPQTRNGVEAFMRERFTAARHYMEQHPSTGALPPRRDLELDALAEVLRGERMVHCHAYRQDEILMFVRLAEEFGFHPGCFQHVLEGYKVANELAAAGAHASTFTDWWTYKYEVIDAIPWNGMIMAERGVNVSFNSDSGELGRRMNLEAAKAVKYGGASEQQALAMVTLNAARQLQVEDRVGSIEVGKDADLALWSANPLSTFALCEQTWVDGKLYFDRGIDREIQAEVHRERDALLALAAREGGAGDTAGAAEEDSVVPVRRVKPRPPRSAGATTTPLALVGATVHNPHGQPMRGATLLLADGRITALGHDLPIAPGTRIVDLDGLHLYPGLVNANTQIGLAEIGAVRATLDTDEVGRLKPQIRAEVSLNPDSELIPVTRINGVTHVLTRPGGGLIMGTSALLRLSGWTWEDLTQQAPAGLHIAFPRQRIDFAADAEKSVQKQRDEIAAEIRELSAAFADARAYRAARRAAAAAEGPAIEIDRRWEALLPAFDGTLPVLIHAGSVPQIKAAIRWALEEDVAPVLVGAREAWRCRDWLAERKVPLLLDHAYRNPSYDYDGWDSAYAAPGLLAAAGVRFALTYGWNANARNLPYAAASCVPHGLDAERALRAITFEPAEILGLGSRFGLLAAGMDATFFVTTGDPLDIRSEVRHLFIAGQEVPLESKQTRLRDRYSQRPRF